MEPSIRLVAVVCLAGLTSAIPVAEFVDSLGTEAPSEGISSATMIRALISAFLVLLGGVFAGLTIGLMGQDEVHLQVVAQSGEQHERRAALKVLKLLSRGKHWVLVTLLLGNVITNETLPIVLDRLLGGGWAAVASSTVAIVIFGEVIPQSISVRYGLALGAFFAPFVLVLMYIMAPAAYPIALLLDYLLGKSHGTVYKKAGLKSLVTLHRTMGVEPLNEDEVTIISAVLDLKDKPVSSIMTPIKDVFVLSADTILNEEMVERIFLTGFNRIPIHAPGQSENFIGMLLVRILITYDPEDCMPVSSFVLATLPETHPDTSCLNILNYFQEGNSHMVAVSTSPGAISGVIGVLTLEDVIEELIGEEIVDESDVYINVHKAIRRRTPGPFKDYKGLISGTGISKLIPSNRAANPHATSNSKITIKRAQASEMTPLLDSDQVINQATSSMPQVRASERAVLAPPKQEGVAMQVGHSHSPHSRYSPVSSLLGATPSRPTYIENVMRVEGFNKVVIAEISSDSESNYSRTQSQSQSRANSP